MKVYHLRYENTPGEITKYGRTKLYLPIVISALSNTLYGCITELYRHIELRTDIFEVANNFFFLRTIIKVENHNLGEHCEFVSL